MTKKTLTNDQLFEALTTQAGTAPAPAADESALSRDPEFVFELLRTQIAEDIARAMVTAGLNENQLAKKLNVSRQAVNEALAMKGNMTLRTLARISVALDCDLSLTLKKAMRCESLTRGADAVRRVKRVAPPSTKGLRGAKPSAVKQKAV